MNDSPGNPNFAHLLNAARKLQPLLDELVFVGGCVTGLLVTDPAAAPVRPTRDVDAIVEVSSYAAFTALEDRLCGLGFRESYTEGAPVCRWIHENLVFDLLPTDSSIFGFGNRWYRAAMENAWQMYLDRYKIKLITAPYFLATKLEAFHGRGRDYRTSRDLEDVLTVIDGRSEIVTEVSDADPALRRFLSDEFRDLSSQGDFLEALPGDLLPDAASQQRLDLVLGRMNQLIFEG